MWHILTLCALFNWQGKHQSTPLWYQGSWWFWWKSFDNWNILTLAAQTQYRLYGLHFGLFSGHCQNYSDHMSRCFEQSEVKRWKLSLRVFTIADKSKPLHSLFEQSSKLRVNFCLKCLTLSSVDQREWKGNFLQIQIRQAMPFALYQVPGQKTSVHRALSTRVSIPSGLCWWTILNKVEYRKLVSSF